MTQYLLKLIAFLLDLNGMDGLTYMIQNQKKKLSHRKKEESKSEDDLPF